MAEKTLTAALVIRAQASQALGVLHQVAEQLKVIKKQTADMRDVAGQVAVVGAGASAAGLGIAYGLDKVITPAMAVEDALHRISNSLPTHTNHVKDLAAAQAAAEATSNRLGISQVGLLKQIYLGTSAGLNMTESIKSMQVASQLAVAANGNLEDVQRTLNLAYINFKDPSLSAPQNIQRIGDAMLTASEKFDYRDVNEVREQLELATPTARQFGTSLKDTLAILGDFTRHGLTGSVAGAAFEESAQGVLRMQEKLGIAMVRNSKGGVDYARSIAAVRQHFIALYGSMAAIPPQVQEQIGKVFGIRGKRVLLIDPSEFASFRATLEKGLLTTQAGAAERMSEAVNQVNRLKEAFTNMAVDIGTTVLPSVVKIAQAIVPVVHGIASFAKSHRELTKLAVEGAAIAAAVLLVGGALALATSAVLGFAAALPLLGALATGAGVAATAVSGLDTAMLLNPIGLAVAGIAALAAAAYELYEHWAGVKEFFLSIWHAIIPDFSGVKGAFALVWSDIRTGAAALGTWAYTAGSHFMQTLAEGMKAAALAPVHAIADLARKIRAYLPFSPAKVGPLRDLHHVRIAETIAQTIKPEPIISAMRRAAAGVALAIPLAMASPALALATAAPALAAASVPALQMTPVHASNVSSPVIHNVVNVNLQHVGNDSNLEHRVRRAVEDALARSGHELMRTLKREQQNRARLEF